MFYTAFNQKQSLEPEFMTARNVSINPLNRKVGLLGGGQLARMLALKGAELGLEIHVLSKSETDPAAQVVRHWHQGDPHQPEDLKKFFEKVDLVTFESEFYSGELLAQISEQTQTPVRPDPHVMRLLQDRLSQKESLLDHDIPTADFVAIHNLEDMREAAALFKNKFVLKKRTGGYDGNGTHVIKTSGQVGKLLEKISIAGNDYIAEAFISFKREVAVVMARNIQGEMIHFPLVQTFQTDNRCDWVCGPIKHPRFEKLVLDLAVYLSEIKYVGVIAFELFDTGRELIVNEVAPRVHNSGHFSLNAMSTDQFTLHWLAILGFDFIESKPLTPAFVMTNLIGTSELSPVFPNAREGHLHWYGKTENRPGRKMGHMNYTGEKSKALLKLALAERKKIKNLGPK